MATTQTHIYSVPCLVMVSAHLALPWVRACWGAGENHGSPIISSPIFAEAREAACGLQISCEIPAYLLKPPWSSRNPFQFFFPPGDGEVCQEASGIAFPYS